MIKSVYKNRKKNCLEPEATELDGVNLKLLKYLTEKFWKLIIAHKRMR